MQNFCVIYCVFQIYLTHPLLVSYCEEDINMTKAFEANVTAYYETFMTTEEQSTIYTSEPPGNETGICKAKEELITNQPNTALFSTILMLGTFLLAYLFKIFRNSKFLGKSVSLFWICIFRVSAAW